MERTDKSLQPVSLHSRGWGGGQDTYKRMSISEDGALKTIEESNVIIKNWVLFQSGWWGKVLFEWVAFEWVDETHKGDKWGGEHSKLGNRRAGDLDRNALDVSKNRKKACKASLYASEGPWNSCLCFLLCCCLSPSCSEISTAVTSSRVL